MATPLTPRTPRMSGITRTGLNLGDTVTLPEGQKAILRFIGKIQNKPGEYAGVELIGEYESQGRHSGTFNGISYFTTSKPNTGLFITYSKLIGSTLRNPGSLAGGGSVSSSGVAPPGSITRNRLSMGPGSIVRPQLQYHSQHPQQHAQQQASPSRKASLVRRQSLAHTVPTTPRRNAANGSITTTNGPPPPSPFFMSPPQADRRATAANNSTNLSRTLSQRTPETSRPLRLAARDTPGDDSRISTLSKELENMKLTIAEKDRFLEEQAQLLHDVEESLHEFQMLAKSQEEQQDASAGPYDIDTLLRTIEERDRKLNNLRAEFEKKRQEFRLTIDSLQQDMQETSEAYETEINTLKENMGQAEVIHSRIVELEYMVTSLEKGLEMSQMSEKNARQQLSNLADIENKLLEKEQELKEASESVEHYRNILKNTDNESNDDGNNSSLAVQQLKTVLEEERKAKQRLEVESREMQIQLSSELDEYKAKYQTLIDEISQQKSELEASNTKIKQLTESQQDVAAYKEKYELSLEEVALLESKIKSLQQEMDLKQQTQTLSTSNSQDPLLATVQEELKSTKSLYEQEKSHREKIQDDVEKLEAMFEAKIFRETELEKEIELLKLHSSPSSRTVSGSSPPTPQLPTSRDGNYDDFPVNSKSLTPSSQNNLPIYKSPSKVDPAAGRTLWCGLCEREGHESLDCPFEEEF